MKLRKYVPVYRDLFLQYFPSNRIANIVNFNYKRMLGKVGDFEIAFLWAMARYINPRNEYQVYDEITAEFPDYSDKTLTTLYRVAFEAAYGKKVMDFVNIERL